jgi:hypothetical protein
MSALEFFTNFVTSGRVEGVGLNSTLGEWADSLGSDYIDDKSRSGKQLRRDYGLVELGFLRRNKLWSCFLISLQVHRLWQYDDNVPQALIDRYGEFPRSLQFQDLDRALLALGYEPKPIADEDGSDIARYSISVSNVLIAVIARAAEESNYPPVGSVWAMHLSGNSDNWARPVKG